MTALRVTFVLLSATAMFCSDDRGARSVGPVRLASAVSPPAFSRAEAAGLFVGVQKFPHDETLTVPFAVDDAVDLAHAFSLNQRIGFVPPRRVVLALSGEPQKAESKDRLRELKEAGARIVRNATQGDILHFLNEQTASTGNAGMLVLSLATHGFQQDGDAYILGSSSAFGSPETSLRIATLLEVAQRAPRSLIFIDACRDRVDPTTRGATADPAAAAPRIKRMAPGQVIFYAAAPGEYAFDDFVHQNGVFTKAVLDGLAECEASAPRGMVVVETLHKYVDREVRRWIQENKKKRVNPATQVSMEGETRNMPLSRCWLPPGPRIRVSFDGATVTAYGEDTRPLWRREFGQPILHAEAADLDADAFYEVVVGLSDRLAVLDRDGEPRWERNGGTLRTFTTGDLFEKKTNQILAIWRDGSSSTSRLSVFDSEGKELSTLDYAGELEHVAVGRPTNMHAPTIAVTTDKSLVLLHARKLTQKWHHALSSADDTISALRIVDADDDSRPDLVITTKGGTTLFTFDGKIVRQPEEGSWTKVPKRTAR